MLASSCDWKAEVVRCSSRVPTTKARWEAAEAAEEEEEEDDEEDDDGDEDAAEADEAECGVHAARSSTCGRSCACDGWNASYKAAAAAVGAVDEDE